MRTDNESFDGLPVPLARFGTLGSKGPDLGDAIQRDGGGLYEPPFSGKGIDIQLREGFECFSSFVDPV